MSQFKNVLQTLQEGILMAVDKALRDAKFDRTIKGRIVGIQSDGVYKVMLNGVTHNVKCDSSHKINDVVRVMIPQNNYSDIFIISNGGLPNGDIDATGGNADTVNYHTVESDVPANAKFTDTVTTINGKTGVIAKSDIVALGIPEKDTTYGIATVTSNGLMSSTDKVKLNNIEEGAKNYVHPDKHSPSIITQDANNRFVTDVEKNTWGNKASTSYVDTKVANLVSSAPETLDTLKELSDALGNDPNFATTVLTEIGKKIDKADGKGLSSNDFTTTEKNKLSNISSDANKVAKSSTNGNVKIDDVETAVYVHPDGTNPHGTNKSDVGLGNVDNTADANKNVASASKLTTARTIKIIGDVTGEALFDGGNNIDITTVIADDSHNHIIANVDGLQSVIDGLATTEFVQNAITNVGGGSGDMSKSVYDTNGDGIVDTADKSRIMYGDDTRSVDSAPSEYMNGGSRFTSQVGIQTEFKYCATIGITSFLSGRYCQLNTMNPWSDSSGGYPVQIVYGDGTPCWRIATSDTTWGDWKALNSGGNADTVDSLHAKDFVRTFNSVTNANSLDVDGFYKTTAEWVGSPYAGANGGNQGYLEHHNWHSANALYAMQKHTSVNGTPICHFRIKDNGTWSAWNVIWTSNIDGAGSSLDADTVDGVHASTLREGLNSNYKDFTVGGDANTYYPVLIGSSAVYGFNRYSITRGYSWTAPDTWNNATHKGGLTFTFEWSGDVGWGGNHKSIRVVEFGEMYTSMVAGMTLTVSGLVVWLRGGNAQYRLQNEAGASATAHVTLGTYVSGDSKNWTVRTDTSNVNTEIYSRYPVRGENQLYAPNDTAYTTSKVRNSRFGTTVPTTLNNGEIFYVYE